LLRFSRELWAEHARRIRKVQAKINTDLAHPCREDVAHDDFVHNIWRYACGVLLVVVTVMVVIMLSMMLLW
jgi:hypothetical protein